MLRARNVNGLFTQGLELLGVKGQASASRNGEVIVAPWPVVSVYENPTERVLFSPERDANPFFHLMEGLWMLAGRDDVGFLDRYIRDFGARYADNGVVHGAYGKRWRTGMGFNQLDHIVKRLRADPTDRQCVLQMWDATECSVDETEQPRWGHDDLNGAWKDRPCNTHVYFRARDKVSVTDDGLNTYDQNVLDMTICCRSNDIVWGAYGANAVHMSMLMEYVAGRVGVDVGTMYQLSNNYHGYVETLDKIGDPIDLSDSDHYDAATVYPQSMGTDWKLWDRDLKRFMEWHDEEIDTGAAHLFFHNKWFEEVAVRVAYSHYLYKNVNAGLALGEAESITATDWRMACTQWLNRREK